MKTVYSLFALVLLCMSCKKETPAPVFMPHDFSKVEVEPLLEDSTLSIRALTVNEKDSSFYFSGNKSTVGFSFIEGPTNFRKTFQIEYDSLASSSLEFRSIAETSDKLFFMSVASPAYLYKIDKERLKDIETRQLPELVYREDHPKAFYDSMNFWNDREGIAIGDSVDGCLSVIITRDGGNTWAKLSCDVLPEGLENEGAFAASNTNISIIGDKSWVATTAGRVYYSPDKGKTWEVFDTPIVKEKDTQGIYSIDFYDELNGFAIGGDYTSPNDNTANKILTKDGGKTWELVAQNQEPGYRSCVQYIPGGEGKELVAIGFKGIDYSKDGGYNWKHLSDEKFYTIRFENDSIAFAAGHGRISRLTFKE